MALDLDGTIIDLDQSGPHIKLILDPRDVEGLARAMAAGITVIPCTGRPFPGALPWAKRIGVDGPIVCYQGAEIRNQDGTFALDHGIGHDLAMEVIRFAREGGLHVQAYRDDRLLVEKDRPEAHEYAEHAGMEINLVPDLDAAMGATTPKLVIVAKAERLDVLLPETRHRWAGKLTIATSTPTYLEFTAANADKATALEFLCGQLGIARDQTVAVGDGRNDASMLAWAGLGVAIEGSEPEVLAAADRTVPGPGRGGIAQLIGELLD